MTKTTQTPLKDGTKIEWCDFTFNPWIGCAKVSAGCANCYAETLMDKRYGRAKWGPNGTRVKTSAANWKKPLKWNRDAARDGVRRRVFCASLADVFEDRNELIAWRDELFALIAETPHLDWLLLTKRPENVNRLVAQLCWPDTGRLMPYGLPTNVWLGTSVENQEQADKRIPELLKVPAAVRFLSMEPLLGPVKLNSVQYNNGGSGGGVLLDVLGGEFSTIAGSGYKCGRIDWVIVGGESGPNARPMHPEWARSIRDECQAAGVPFFFKQWGEHDGNEKRVGKKAAGRLLDGCEWSEFPQTNHIADASKMVETAPPDPWVNQPFTPEEEAALNPAIEDADNDEGAVRAMATKLRSNDKENP
jgi:protein gp37